MNIPFLYSSNGSSIYDFERLILDQIAFASASFITMKTLGI